MVVGAIFVVQATGSGLAFYNLSVLLDAFVVQRGFPVSQASFATACFFLASGIAGMIAGRLIDRIDLRYVMAASGVLSALTLAALAWLHDTWQLYLFYLALGFSYGGAALVPGATVVTRWFHAHRALALSVASSGLSLGGVLFTPLSALAIKSLGLQGAAPWLAAAYFLGVVPVTLLLVRPSPQAMGLVPDGRRGRDREDRGPIGAGMSFADARRTRFFIGVTIAYMFALGAQVGAIAHVFRLAATRLDAQAAAGAVALLASASLVGRLAGGWLLAWKMPARGFALAMLGVQAAALALLGAAGSKAALLAGVAAFGIAVGNVLMMQPLLLAEAFGTREYGRIYSTSQFFTVLGLAGGPALLGALYEASGDYALPYFGAAAAAFVGLIVLLLAGKPTARR